MSADRGGTIAVSSHSFALTRRPQANKLVRNPIPGPCRTFGRSSTARGEIERTRNRSLFRSSSFTFEEQRVSRLETDARRSCERRQARAGASWREQFAPERAKTSYGRTEHTHHEGRYQTNIYHSSGRCAFNSSRRAPRSAQQARMHMCVLFQPCTSRYQPLPACDKRRRSTDRTKDRTATTNSAHVTCPLRPNGTCLPA